MLHAFTWRGKKGSIFNLFPVVHPNIQFVTVLAFSFWVGHVIEKITSGVEIWLKLLHSIRQPSSHWHDSTPTANRKKKTALLLCAACFQINQLKQKNVCLFPVLTTRFSLLSLPAWTSQCYLREATICISFCQVICKVEVVYRKCCPSKPLVPKVPYLVPTEL